MINQCLVCGREFQAFRTDQKVCSQECGREYTNMTAREKVKKYKAEREVRKTPAEDLETVARKAREAGMTYGEYVGQMITGRVK